MPSTISSVLRPSLATQVQTSEPKIAWARTRVDFAAVRVFVMLASLAVFVPLARLASTRNLVCRRRKAAGHEAHGGCSSAQV